MLFRVRAAAACVVAFSAASSAEAALFVTPVFNNSFENTFVVSGGFTQSVANWAEERERVDLSPNTEFVEHEAAAGYPATPYGTNWGGFAAQDGAAIYQQVGTWDANASYDVSLLVGARSTQALWAGMTVQLWRGGNSLTQGFDTDGADGTTLASRGALLIASSGDLGRPGAASTAATQERTVTLSTGAVGTAGEPLWLRLVRTNGTAGQAQFDNISVAPVPEPAGVALTGLAATGLLARRRRRSRA